LTVKTIHKRKHITLLIADNIIKWDTFNSTCKTFSSTKINFIR